MEPQPPKSVQKHRKSRSEHPSSRPTHEQRFKGRKRDTNIKSVAGTIASIREEHAGVIPQILQKYVERVVSLKLRSLVSSTEASASNKSENLPPKNNNERKWRAIAKALLIRDVSLELAQLEYEYNEGQTGNTSSSKHVTTSKKLVDKGSQTSPSRRYSQRAALYKAARRKYRSKSIDSGLVLNSSRRVFVKSGTKRSRYIVSKPYSRRSSLRRPREPIRHVNSLDGLLHPRRSPTGIDVRFETILEESPCRSGDISQADPEISLIVQQVTKENQKSIMRDQCPAPNIVQQLRAGIPTYPNWGLTRPEVSRTVEGIDLEVAEITGTIENDARCKIGKDTLKRRASKSAFHDWTNAKATTLEEVTPM